MIRPSKWTLGCILAAGIAGAEPSDPIEELTGKQMVALETSQGTIEQKLFPEVAPKACENFVSLVEKGYYDGLTFHRVIRQFMIQGGDPTGTGAGGESVWGAPFEDEFDKSVRFDRPGLLAMANAGPRTNGSQFFITTVPTPWLNDKHTIFGEVVGGMEVVKKIEAAPTKILKAAIRPSTPDDKFANGPSVATSGFTMGCDSETCGEFIIRCTSSQRPGP